jgi:DNA-binding NtrC family response regulator/tetratricopeptide (TPR) repeat protein
VATPDLFGQAVQALDRGRGSEATTLLVRALRKPGLGREEQIQIRCALADAWLLQDDIRQATEALGRPPEARERLDPARVSDLWRMHGRLAAARGEPSRGIAFLTKALQAAERAHDSRAIGLAHFELGLCYRQVGDTAIVREHLTQAASALHAVGDRRHLAMVHSLSGITLAQEGRLDEAMSALSQAERLALLVEAGDVLATVCGNQANVALMQHRHEQALTLAERSVELQQQGGTPHGLGVALASLGQICVRVGSLNRAEEALNRALDVRSPLQFMRETTGAVFDTLAQIHLIRGEHEAASRCLQKAREAYGEYGSQTSRWYQWSLLVLESRLALRRGQPGPAVALASDVAKAPEAPPAYVLQGELIAVEALMASNLNDEAQRRLDAIAGRINPVSMSGTWGEFLRLRGRLHRVSGRSTEAYHDFGQSVSVFELLGERHQAGLSYLELGRLAASAGAKSRATRYLSDAVAIFDALGAAPDLAEARQALSALPAAATGGYVGVQMDGEDALVRRIVDAAVMPALLAREGATALLEACDAEAAILFVQMPSGQVRVAAASGCDSDTGRALATSALRINDNGSGIGPMIEPLGRDVEGPRFAVVSGTRPFQGSARQRFRTLCAVLKQGFDLCAARDRQAEAVGGLPERPLEPLLPGFVCASTAMQRVVEQIQRMQGNDLTVLITGESGTGKDLVARAIHSGSLRRGSMFLPYNCTSATRELADSQLFGHRRGSFTGAIADQPGVLRTAVGGTLFLDEVGDLPLDVQPKLLRFLEQGEVLPVGDTRPQRVDVRVVAATNADLEQRVSDGTFREDLFYRLSVIRIHVPPLRERREEIPHLSTFFLREASERLGKPGVRLSAETLDLFDSFQWPGNVRQLRNEVQRAVAMALPGGLIKPDLLSPVFSAAFERTGDTVMRGLGRRASLSSAVESLERDLIEGALEQAAGNISETARSLGLTRRGLYLKMQRLGVSAARL